MNGDKNKSLTFLPPPNKPDDVEINGIEPWMLLYRPEKHLQGFQ
jgi:hypothetical protein